MTARSKISKRPFDKLLMTAVLACTCLSSAGSAWASGGQTVTSFTTPADRTQYKSPSFDYTIDPRSARYFIYVPANYTGNEAFGLIVYVSPNDQTEALPDGWADVLQRRKLLMIIPQNAGNGLSQERRGGLAVLGAVEMMRNYKVDRSRVYAAGLSGGARTASDLGLKQSDVFCGTIQDCGSNFYRDVQQRYATSFTDTNGNHYGVTATTPEELAAARNKTKFVLITGSGDFRRGNILDIFHGGFEAEHFKSKLFDVDGMGHQDCDARTLEQALDFLK